MVKKFLPVLVALLVVIATLPVESTSVKKELWTISHAGQVPYLSYCDLPYFGRFDTSHPIMPLDGVWRFAVDDCGDSQRPPKEGWEPIHVPGVWNYLRPEMLDYIGVGWYRLDFTPDKKMRGDLVRIVFGGVAMRCSVWLNDKPLGDHEGGYTAFSFDVTGAMKPCEKNTLLVRVDNRMTFTSLPPLNYENSRMGWWEYGGIHRTVYLEAHPENTIFKIAANTFPISEDVWRISADTLVFSRDSDVDRDGFHFEAEVLDVVTGKMAIKLKPSIPLRSKEPAVWGATMEGKLENPTLWSPRDPTGLYRLNVRIMKTGVVVDSASTVFAFRRLVADEKGLFLNGEPYYIRGINRHEDDPVAGLAETHDVIERDIDLIKGLNCNHMRTGHYPNDPLFLDRTDIRGIGITEEIPLYQAGVGFVIWLRDRVMRKQKIGKMHMSKVVPSQFENPELVGNAVLSLVEMIERDRNHPSVLAWSVGNENWTFSKESRYAYKILKKTAKHFDPDRPVTFALLQFGGFGPIREKCADLADFISLNEYFGWYVGEIEDARGFIEKLHRKYPNKPIVISEFGAGAVMDPSKVRTKREGGQGTFDPQYQAELIAAQWKIFLEMPCVWGAMPWILADFRNGWFKEEHPLPYFNTKGVLTHDRKPKPAYFTLRDIYADIEKNPPEWARK